MPWIIGVDEAGYGPNLGPFVMASVACRVPDVAQCDLWTLLRAAVRKSEDEADERLVGGDSKKVYNSGSGLGNLERGVLGALWRRTGATLHDFVSETCAGSVDELQAETWYRGDQRVPGHMEETELAAVSDGFDRECTTAGVQP